MQRIGSSTGGLGCEGWGAITVPGSIKGSAADATNGNKEISINK